MKTINQHKLNEIIKESIKRVLSENNNNTWEDLMNDIDSKYHEDEPWNFVDDFKYYVESVLSDAYGRAHDEDWLDNYYHASPDAMGEYTNMVREKVNTDFEQIYDTLKQYQIKSNADLDECVKMYTTYKQGGKPSMTRG